MSTNTAHIQRVDAEIDYLERAFSLFFNTNTTPTEQELDELEEHARYDTPMKRLYSTMLKTWKSKRGEIK